MKHLWLTAIFLSLTLGAGTAPRTIVHPFETEGDLTPVSEIDRLVFSMLDRRGLEPANLCSDAVFLRRAYLDVIGTMPTEEEARSFLDDRDPKKRGRLIDDLLEREEFADYRAMKWSDLLRVKAEFPINLWPNAAQAYHRWIRTSIRENKPYDRFARELLTSSGSNFQAPQVNFHRAIQGREPTDMAQAVALTFMGARAENWPRERLDGMAGFFSRVGFKSTAEWKEEIVFFDMGKPPAKAVFPDGVAADIPLERDPREAFADWLISPENPWFARNMVNRVWHWLLGYGIIHEPDDIRPDNPPSHEALLLHLEGELIHSGWDLRHIHRVILNSKTYQLSSIPRAESADPAARFASYPVRRLDAEVLIDAINFITGGTETYVSPIPEPFTFLPADQRAITLADGSIGSSFLDLFGRPSRDTGLQSERTNVLTAGQRLHLLNSSHIQRKIEQSPKLRRLSQARGRPRWAVDSLYLSILSRFPTEEEWRHVSSHLETYDGSRRDAFIDLAWALLNSAEFLYRH